MMRWRLLLALLLALYLGYSFTDKFDPDVIRDKRVLVTGASTGIGEQLAYHYARLGARLVITARRESRLKEVVKRCREVGPKDGVYHYIVADMSDMAHTKMVIKETNQKLGGLDILVLNHKMDNKLNRWTGSDQNLTFVDKTLDVNTKAYIHLASHAMPLLEQNAGSVIVLSSGFGKVAPPYNIAYAASKFALDGFFHGLRQELAIRKSSISITVCALGLIGTESVEELLTKTGVRGLTAPEDSADTALAIIKGGASRVREIYYPYYQLKPLVLFRDWFPDLFEIGYAQTFAMV